MRLLYLKQAKLWEAFEAAINIIHPLKHRNTLLYSTVDGLEDFEGLTSLKITHHAQVETQNSDAPGSGLSGCAGDRGNHVGHLAEGTVAHAFALGIEPKLVHSFLFCLIFLFSELVVDALYFGAILCSTLQGSIEQSCSPGEHSDTRTFSPPWGHSI